MSVTIRPGCLVHPKVSRPRARTGMLHHEKLPGEAHAPSLMTTAGF
jgi:hypothetical protein